MAAEFISSRVPFPSRPCLRFCPIRTLTSLSSSPHCALSDQPPSLLALDEEPYPSSPSRLSSPARVLTPSAIMSRDRLNQIRVGIL